MQIGPIIAVRIGTVAMRAISQEERPRRGRTGCRWIRCRLDAGRVFGRVSLRAGLRAGNHDRYRRHHDKERINFYFHANQASVESTTASELFPSV